MTTSQQLTEAFARGENYALLTTAIGRVLITRKSYTDAFGTERTAFKAQSLEVGETVVCKAANPFIALTTLYGFVNSRRSN